MGLFTTSPAMSGARFRDDYGATRTMITSYSSFCIQRNIPVAQSQMIVTVGDKNNAN